ncbi:MAG: hypothetical protein ACYC1E_07390 [Propionibacteriaceae bacterium]
MDIADGRGSAFRGLSRGRDLGLSPGVCGVQLALAEVGGRGRHGGTHAHRLEGDGERATTRR